MRIKELAELTGTTVRTIRFYHQTGLLPIPARRDGRRDYDLTQVARLVRVRWLAQAGIPLARIATVLDDRDAGAGPRHETTLTDLRAVVTALDDQIQQLTSQRDRMRNLIIGLERDGQLSPMPAPVARFYDRMYARAPDDRTRRVVRKERDFMELAFYRGEMPVEAVTVYEQLTETGLADSLVSFGQIARRRERTGRLSETEVAAIASATVERLRGQLGATLLTIDLTLARQAADLYVRLTEPDRRHLARAIADALLAEIEKER
ncbi:MerR family transcriptional regulator [Actinoplanes sp. NPDC020271]|uniref:MerR family transcriptional regulator n=1 Tax=Actinoplanes sp. NPDC020271 TaxID=3363896 RepID=UPI0037AF66EB